MTPQELKASILQLAIQGKLVPQIESEGNAEDLFKEIQKEKQRLIDEKKIKKEKPLEPIKDEDIPFDIPSSWKWVRLVEVIDVRDGTHDTPKYVDKGVPLVTSKNLENGKINFEGAKPISISDANEINKRSGVDDLDILFAMIGSIGNPVLVHKDREFCIKNVALFKSYNKSLFSMDYLYQVLMLAQDNMKKVASGGVQSFVSLGFLRNYLIPLPPLEEQKRIVAKIEELLPLVERYGKAYERLEEFNKKFPGDMKKSVLQMAIQGKLVEQRPEEGTAEELYELIQTEKARLIKEGKIKKEKPLEPIKGEEIPFDIPSSWKWCRLGELGEYRKGPFGSSLTKAMFVPKSETSVKVYEQKNAIKKDYSIGEYYISQQKYEEMKGFEVLPHDIIVSCAGTIGETYFIPNDAPIGIINQALMRVRLVSNDIVPFWLLYFDYILKAQAKINSSGTAIKNIPPFEVLKAYCFPLPPLEEQKRIVAKIEEVLPLCDALIK